MRSTAVAPSAVICPSRLAEEDVPGTKSVWPALASRATCRPAPEWVRVSVPSRCPMVERRVLPRHLTLDDVEGLHLRPQDAVGVAR